MVNSQRQIINFEARWLAKKVNAITSSRDWFSLSEFRKIKTQKWNSSTAIWSQAIRELNFYYFDSFKDLIGSDNHLILPFFNAGFSDFFMKHFISYSKLLKWEKTAHDRRPFLLIRLSEYKNTGRLLLNGYSVSQCCTARPDGKCFNQLGIISSRVPAYHGSQNRRNRDFLIKVLVSHLL